MELHTIGIDLGKTSLSSGWAQPVRRGCGAQEVFAQPTSALHGQSAGPLNWHGSVRRATFSGAGHCESRVMRCG